MSAPVKEKLMIRKKLIALCAVAGAIALAAWPASAGDVELDPSEIPAVVAATIRAPVGGRISAPAPIFNVGAARASLTPAPETFGGTTWQTSGCTLYGYAEFGNIDQTHLLPDPTDLRAVLGLLRGWPAASPDCIYLGGFGLGPVRPALRVGNGGVWVRAIAISNGETTFTYAIADTVGWFAHYNGNVCLDCGIGDVRKQLAHDLRIPVANVIVGSTHTHAGADTYGGWGGIPSWYRNQLRDATIAAIKQAVANLRPANIRVGEVHLRNRNNERRDTYHSTADTGATWLQAVDLEGRMIATWATFAGHPTIVGDAILHADWPGAAARRFESAYGSGVGLMFEGGLGNVSVSGVGGANDEEAAENTGIAIANDILDDVFRGLGSTSTRELADNGMQTAVADITHPTMTNVGLVTLASAGLFDREFTPTRKGAGLPGAYYWSKAGQFSSADLRSLQPPDDPAMLRGCASAGPTIITTTGAHKIGEFAVAFAPGEIFSNIVEVVKEKADRSAVTMVLGQTNDALGYIIQSFEYDIQGNVITEYGTMTGEYEEVFAIDRCFGDHVLQTILDSTRALGFGG